MTEEWLPILLVLETEWNRGRVEDEPRSGITPDYCAADSVEGVKTVFWFSRRAPSALV
jgi:hypothetical protein